MAKVRYSEVESSNSGDERDGRPGRRTGDGGDTDNHRLSTVHLSVPWGYANTIPLDATRPREIARVVEDRSRVHAEWIRQDARTKRLALIIGAVLFLGGCLVIVFAPSGREAVAGMVGAAMLVVAAGTAGYRRVWGRAPGISVGAGDSEFTAAGTADATDKPRRTSRRR